MGRSRYKVIDTRPHFLTCTTVNWLILFSQPEVAQILLSSLQYLQNQQRLTLHAYVIMENHLHLIASAEDLSREMHAFKSFTAQAIIKHLQQRQMTSWLDQLRLHKQQFKQNSTYQVWQEGCHPQVIQSPEMLQQKISYIHHNPVRRGYIDDPSHWRYSSARNYSGLQGILEIEHIPI